MKAADMVSKGSLVLAPLFLFLFFGPRPIMGQSETSSPVPERQTAKLEEEAPAEVDPTVADLAALRVALEDERWSLVGHS